MAGPSKIMRRQKTRQKKKEGHPVHAKPSVRGPGGYGVPSQKSITPKRARLKKARKTARQDARSVAKHRAATPDKRTHFSSRKGAKQDIASSIARSKAIVAGEDVPNPAVSRKAALEGIKPPESMAKFYPRAYTEQLAQAVAASEAINPDPIPEIVGTTVATGGTASLVKGGVRGALALGGKVLAKDVEKEVAEVAGKKAAGAATKNVAKRVKPKKAYTEKVSRTERRIKGDQPRSSGRAPRPVRRIKDAPKRAVKRVKSKPRRTVESVKAAPKRVRTAPKRAASTVKKETKALGTKPGRKAIPRKVAGKARAHPLIAAGALSTVADKSGVDLPVVKQLAATSEGMVTADPKKALPTTARAIPGILTGVAAPVLAAGQSAGRSVSTLADTAGVPGAKSYTPAEIASPTVETVKEQAKGMAELAKPYIAGDKEAIKKSVEDELGYSLVVMSPKVLKMARDSKAYRGARGAARAKVADRRAAKRSGEMRKDPKDRKSKPSVEDKVHGGDYINRRLGNAIENRRKRKKWSKEVTRDTAGAQAEAHMVRKPVHKALSKMKGSKKYKQGAADSVKLVANQGIPRNRAAALAELERIEKNVKKPDTEKMQRGASLHNDHAVIKFLRDNPKIFKDEKFWEAVDAYKKGAKPITINERAPQVAQAGVHGVKRPEQRMVEGVEINGKIVKTKDWNPDTIERKQARVRELRAKQREHSKEANMHEPGSPEFYGAVKREGKAKEKADKIDGQVKNHKRAYAQASKDFNAEMAATRAAHGLEEPAWASAQKKGSGPLSSEPAFPGKTPKKLHRGEDKMRRSGELDRSYKQLLSDSVLGPRLKKVLKKLDRRFVQDEAIQVMTKNGKRRFLTTDEIIRAVNRGEIDPGQFSVYHSQHFKSSVKDKNAKQHDVGDFTNLDDLVKDIDSRKLEPGHKYVVVRKQAAKEFQHQLNSQASKLAKANRLGSRAILGYNPAWAAAQMLAEGIPATVAVGGNPLRWKRIFEARRDMKKMSPEDRAPTEGLVGTTMGTDGFPMPGVDAVTGKGRSAGVALTKRDKTAAALADGVKGRALGKFDKTKGAEFRRWVAMSAVDKEFNGVFKGTGGVLKIEEQVRKHLKGQSLAEQQAYIAKHPVLSRQLEAYVDDIMGNWRAVSHLEANVAPLVAFYPYVRYSFKWVANTFPKQHPLKAQMLYFMSQQNAEQLEKLVDGKPANWLEYAFPVTSADGESKVSPVGSRISPTLNALTQAVGSNALNQVLTGVNPVLGAAYQGISGNDPFTGKNITSDVGEKALLGLAAFASMLAPVRYLSDSGLPEKAIGERHVGPVKVPTSLRDIKPRKGYRGGAEYGQSDTSKEIEATDPHKLARSMGNIFATQSGEDYKEKTRIIRELNAGTYYDDEPSTSSSTTAPATPFKTDDSSYVPFGGAAKPPAKGKKAKKAYVPFGGQ